MRTSRVFRWAFKIFLLVLVASMSIVSYLGSFSAILIIGEGRNIAVPDTSRTFKGNFTSSNPADLYMDVPYMINNTGFFSLTNINISFDIDMVFINQSNNNVSTRVHIFSNSSIIPDIISGEKRLGYYNTTSSSFLTDNMPNPLDVNLDHDPKYYLDVFFSASYSLGLLSFSINLVNINITSVGGI